MKKCIRCAEIKSLDEFCNDAARKDGKSNYCKICKFYMRSPNKTTKEQAYINKVSKNYGLTALQVKNLFKKANYCCQICSSTKELGIDHDHNNNQIRGILCNDCNRSLGMMKDSVEILSKAINYLKQTPKEYNLLLVLNRLTTKGGI